MTTMRATGVLLGLADPPLPFWAFPWAGGLAVVGRLLAHPDEWRGGACSTSRRARPLCDRRGASRAIGVERWTSTRSPKLRSGSTRATGSRSRSRRDLLDAPPPAVDVILAGDVCYEETMAARMIAWLWRRRRQARGSWLAIQDAYLPANLAPLGVPRCDESRTGAGREHRRGVHDGGARGRRGVTEATGRRADSAAQTKERPDGAGEQETGNVPDDFIKPRAGSTPAQAGHSDRGGPIAAAIAVAGIGALAATTSPGTSATTASAPTASLSAAAGATSSTAAPTASAAQSQAAAATASTAAALAATTGAAASTGCSDERRREHVGDHRPNRGLADQTPSAARSAAARRRAAVRRTALDSARVGPSRRRALALRRRLALLPAAGFLDTALVP